jgi:ComB9 competence protein
MVTVVELPRGEIIEAVDLGDDGGFSVKPRGERRLAVRPSGYGYDTSLVVYGKSGAIYPFYLRAESFNSVNVPDLIVRIEGSVQIDGDPAVSGFAGVLDDKGKPALPAMSVPGQGNKPASIDSAIAGLNDTNPGTPDGDFVAQSPFDPNALHGWGDYDLWGDETLRPETVFRDDHFTYIRFGKRWKDVELPTAYVVVDGIVELVNTRVQGETYIIESTRPLITLKSGQSFLCIEYTGA